MSCADDPNPPERVLPPDATIGADTSAPLVATTQGAPPPTDEEPTTTVPPIIAVSSFASLDEIAVRLDCTQFAVAELDSSGAFAENRSAAATCTLDDGTLALSLFANTDRRDAWIAQGRDFGCDAARELEIPAFYFAVGENWAVEPADVVDEAAAEAIAATLGGTARTIDC